MSFVFDLDEYCENGQATQANPRVAASRGPPNRSPTSHMPTRQSRSQRIDVAWAVGSLSQFPHQPNTQNAGQVGLVGDRAVGVALGVGRLAAAVRLDVVADLAARVGGPAGGPAVLDREVAVGVDAVGDPLGADHPGEADVDHVRVPPVEADPEPAEEHGRADQQPDRPHGRASRGAVLLPDPEAAREQPDEARVDERHRGEDVAAVEEPERDRERQHHQQVDRPQREEPPPVDEADQEERAEARARPGRS